MKRTVSLWLCLCMLLTAVTLLSSCKKEYTGEPEVSKKTVDVDLTDYTLVYPGAISSHSQEQVRAFAQSFRTVIGSTIRASKDNGSSNGKEILVGQVDREETKKALSGIKGHGYTIQVLEDKIVIVGTSYVFTELALKFFAENYLNGKNSGKSTLSINKKVLLENVPTVTLTSDGAHHYSFVISHLLDTESGFPQKHWGSPSSASQDTDQPYDLYLSMLKKLGSVTSVKSPVKPVLDSVESVANEILVGQVDRDECRDVLETMSANEYGIVVKNGKVVVTAWNDEGLILAASLFEAMLVDAVIEDESGNKSIVLPADYRSVYAFDEDEAFVTEFPKPEDDTLELITTASAGNGGLVWVYQGDGASAAGFDDYIAQLKSEGYSVIMENVIRSSKFTTLKNTETQTVLHVEFDAYEYAGGLDFSYSYAETETGYFMYVPTLRVVSMPLNETSVPGSDLMQLATGQKICDTSITQLKLAYANDNSGMSYIITLEDGSFIIFDGGTNLKSEGNTGTQETYLWSVLNDLYRKVHGTDPVKNEKKIHIRAWILTHEHVDHFGVMNAFFKAYGKSGLMQIDYLMGNFASDAAGYNSFNPSHSIRNSISNMQANVSGGFTYLKLHTGQKLYIRNVEIEVLYTQESVAPHRIRFFNDTSTVTRFTIHTTDKNTGATVNEQTVVWLGDVYLNGSVFMRSMYGDYLKSDIVQVSHHGGDGVEKELYALIDPTAALWPIKQGSFANQIKNPPTSDRWSNGVDRYLAYEAPSLRYIYVADTFNTTIFFKEDGADYENLYDANGIPESDKTVVFDSYSVIKVENLRTK